MNCWNCKIKINVNFYLWRIFFVAACVSDNNCSPTQACIDGYCVDPCASYEKICQLYGIGYTCQVVNHKAQCVASAPSIYEGWCHFYLLILLLYVMTYVTTWSLSVPYNSLKSWQPCTFNIYMFLFLFKIWLFTDIEGCWQVDVRKINVYFAGECDLINYWW